MKFRVLKRCNDLKVSEIALGCEGFMGKSREEFKAMLDRAIGLSSHNPVVARKAAEGFGY